MHLPNDIMSFSSYNKKKPYYKILPNENFIRYVYRLVRSIIQMYPYAHQHGFRYYVDTDFRRRISYRRKNHYKHLVRRQREGSFSRSHVKAKLKLMLVDRDKEFCNLCNKPFLIKNLTIDHVLPLFMGGNSEINNLQLLCEPCHRVKSKQEYENHLNTTTHPESGAIFNFKSIT